MTNSITTSYNGMEVESIDNALPFEGKNVYVKEISKRQTGYGHWKITLRMDVNDKELSLNMTTTDSQGIDKWSDEDGYNMETLSGFACRVIENNESEIEEFIQEAETQE